MTNLPNYLQQNFRKLTQNYDLNKNIFQRIFVQKKNKQTVLQINLEKTAHNKTFINSTYTHRK